MSREPETLPVDETSLVGVWCDFSNFAAPHGYMVTDELTLRQDHTFVWRIVEFEDYFGSNSNFAFAAVAGQWQLEDGQLDLEMESGEHQNHTCNFIRFSTQLRVCDHDHRHRGSRELLLNSVTCRTASARRDLKIQLALFESLTTTAEDNHSEVRQKLSQIVTVDGPFKKLISLLTKEVPAAVSQLEIGEPLFCVRLVYYDTHAPAEGYGVIVRCLTESLRQQVLAKQPGWEVPDSLWHPTLGVANDSGPGVVEVDLTSIPKLQDLFQQIYQLLSKSEDENMPKLRAALQQTAAKLNKAKWPSSLGVTDDFVVCPADGSEYFGGEYAEDLEKSLPKKRLAEFRKLGYLL